MQARTEREIPHLTNGHESLNGSGHKESTNPPPAPPIFQDLPLAKVIMGSIEGNEQAQEALDETVRPILTGFFLKNTDYDNVDDLTQEAFIQFFGYLSRFDPRKGKGAFKNNFIAWVNQIARSRLGEMKRKASMKGEKEESLDEHIGQNHRIYPLEPEPADNSYDITDETILNVIQGEFTDMLTDREYEIVELKAKGIKAHQISEILKLKTSYVKAVSTHARAKIEVNILSPAGFIPVGRSLSKNAHSRWFKTIKILGRYYSQEQEIEAYRRKKFLHLNGGRNSEEEQTIFEHNPDSGS